MPGLFSPLTIKGVTLRNRIGMSPMTMYRSTDGRMTDFHVMYLGARAAGGFGLVFAEQIAIAPEGRTSVHCAGIYDDDQIPGHARVTAMIRDMGAVPAIQLGHTGRCGSEVKPWEDGPMTASPRFQRLEPAQRRESILATATRLFASLPYAQVSTAAIAAEAGVARGLVNHYFGTKRALYLEVVDSAATVPPAAVAALPAGGLDSRIEAAVDWFLTSLSDAGGSWLALTGSHSLSRDPDLERILAAAEDSSVDRVIEAVGLGGSTDPEKLRALTRPYGQLARAAGREWLLKGTLTRPEAHRLLTDTLSTIVRRVHPALSADDPGDRVPNRS